MPTAPSSPNSPTRLFWEPRRPRPQSKVLPPVHSSASSSSLTKRLLRKRGGSRRGGGKAKKVQEVVRVRARWAEMGHTRSNPPPPPPHRHGTHRTQGTPPHLIPMHTKRKDLPCPPGPSQSSPPLKHTRKQAVSLSPRHDRPPTNAHPHLRATTAAALLLLPAPQLLAAGTGHHGGAGGDVPPRVWRRTGGGQRRGLVLVAGRTRSTQSTPPTPDPPTPPTHPTPYTVPARRRLSARRGGPVQRQAVADRTGTCNQCILPFPLRSTHPPTHPP